MQLEIIVMCACMAAKAAWHRRVQCGYEAIKSARVLRNAPPPQHSCGAQRLLKRREIARC